MCQHHSPQNNKDLSHDEEHKIWSRRSFLQALGIAGTGTMMLGTNSISASSVSPLTMALSQAETDNILVLVRLVGGNDGLNTIIPFYDYDNYVNARPTIHIPQDSLICLTQDFAIPNYMEPLQAMFGEGKMRAIHGVGYDDPNLSHFTSSDIWATAEDEDRIRNGWLGRYYEHLYPDYFINPPENPAAVQIGNFANLVFEGYDKNYAFVLSGTNQLQDVAENGTMHDMLNLPDCTYGDQLEYMRGSINTTYTYAEKIHAAYGRASNAVAYQDTGIARQLATVARLIKGNLGTKVYMVSLGGFDTHSGQPERHSKLMSELSDAMARFYEDLDAGDMSKYVLGMTFSEFGRRVFENGSEGTDHGAAAPILMFGPGLNGNEFIGEHPSLSATDRGNLVSSIDFRDVYATVMAKWLCIDETVVSEALLDKPYEALELGFDCNGSSTPNPTEQSIGAYMRHRPYYPAENTPYIYFELPVTAHVDIQLYNMIGQRVASIANEMMFSGSHKINIKEKINTRLHTGQYIYSISIQDKKFSKSVVIR
ncbi:DUF1501 domain-containing protein [Leptobacterium flavescens]|uniref:DUF1501 domain-containing protein n=1 Tax=Leptobacterium flavescens TaxID=472055 RepID=A0A6P0UI69_9FLAO|nr:DUF1501 domain-containing protein [Leptobacterium flavescens]NER12944.1 DUF1501 domain-containing protein [Leptobacterium flavescens]